MRILHVLDHSIPLHSGYTFRTLSILQAQRARGWETEHVTGIKHNHDAKVNGPVEEVDGLRFHRTLDSGGLMGKLPVLNQWAVVKTLERRILEIAPDLKPDILHAHSPALDGLAAVRAGARLGIPVVYEVRAFWEDAAVDHGTTNEGSLRYKMGRSLESKVLRQADAITTIAAGLRDDIIGRGIPAEKVTVVPNAVDAGRFTRNEPDPALAAELGLAGKKVLGFLGSFYAYEGLTLLLDALPRILENEPDARLLLVGGGFQDELLRTKAKDLGVADKVTFTGRVPHEKVQTYYALVDVLVYPRLSMRLTELVTPLKPLEAMAQHKALLASDVGGHKELIADGVTGVLFKAGDVDALATAAVDLLGDPARWQKLGDQGRTFIEGERSWAKVVERYAPIYERLLER